MHKGVQLYNRYFELNYINMLEDFENINLPENEYLEYNFLNKLKDNNFKKIIFKNSKIKLTTSEFIEKAIEVHGNKYNYSLVDYVNSKTKVKIICSIHGIFEQTPNHHLRGSGCPKCIININSNKRKSNSFEFIKKAIEIHGNKYDYSLVDYIKSINKVTIICPIHGEFKQTPHDHLCGSGCPKCAYIINSNKRKSNSSEFIEKAIKVHGNKYNYSLVDYVNSKTKVKIICPIHGEFEQEANSHLRGSGCPNCGSDIIANKLSLTTSEFIEKAIEVHGNKYNYSLINYVNYYNKVKIICSIHGIFEQTPDNHLQGNGCSKCCNNISSYEEEICEFLKKNNIKYIQSDRQLISPYELDIVIPEFKLAIEVNGQYWHSEQVLNNNNDYKKLNVKKYHQMKFDMCKNKNIQLLTIFESEWNTKKDLIKSMILVKCKKIVNKIGARQCVINEINGSLVKNFLNDNHIQGYVNGQHFGLFYNNELVSLITFQKINNIIYLQRFCSKKYMIINGSFNKLLKYFIKTCKINKIVTFSDNRYSNGLLYKNNGFVKLHEVEPSYYYFKNAKVDLFHKRNFQHQHLKLKLKNYNFKLTEYQNMLNHGYDRIWDCGKIKWELLNL